MASRADRQVSGPTCKLWLSLLPRVENNDRVQTRTLVRTFSRRPLVSDAEIQNNRKRTYPQNDHSPWIEWCLDAYRDVWFGTLAAVPKTASGPGFYQSG